MSASSVEPRKPRRFAIRGMLTVAAAAAGATLVAVSAASGSYALWADTAPVQAGIVKSGSLALVIDASTMTTAPWATMFPGDKVRQQITLKNTGSVDSVVTVIGASTVPAVANDYEVRVAEGACAGALPDPTNTLDGTSRTVGDWAKGSSGFACVEVTLKAAAEPASHGAELPFTLTFTATQKAVGA